MYFLTFTWLNYLNQYFLLLPEYCSTQVSTLYLSTDCEFFWHLWQERQEARTTCSGDGGRGGGAEVADLEHQPHGGVQGYPLVTGQGQHLGEGKQRRVHTVHLHPLLAPGALCYVTCFPQLFGIFSASRAHTVTSALIHRAQIVYYSLVPEMSQVHAAIQVWILSRWTTTTKKSP